ncbi:MAG: M61 family metallopeptidase [Cyanobacteria bacterium P01_A01_bin.17]
MTEAVRIPNIASSAVTPSIHYQVEMPNPASHLFDVTLTIQNQNSAILDLKLPVWTPGSYLVREYAKHLQTFRVEDAQGQALSWRKVSKNHWQIEAGDVAQLKVRYQVFAHELTVRTNHLDASHGFLNPGAVLMYIPGFEEAETTLTVTPPEGWTVTTALSPVEGKLNTFVADTFDTLVDSPVEIGTHSLYNFDVLGKPHQWAIWGKGNFDIDRIIADTQKIVEVEAKIFGGLPYDRYFFLLHLSAGGYGGLEHKFCTTLLFPRFNFRTAESYNKFMCLVAHEFFHLWNVKRIRPKALETFDYDQENYTDCLWFCEGVTSFYDLAIPMRAGIYDAKNYLKLISDSITRLQAIPGRQVQSLSESSFDTWIKLYRPDANSKNAQVSYYLKGELVSLLLDLLIRRESGNMRSQDQVMQKMWQQFGQSETGYTHAQLKSVVESVAGIDLTDFWEKYIEGTVELPYDGFLNPFGLGVKVETAEDAPPYLGIELKSETGTAMVKTVFCDSPAHDAGIAPDDQILAIDGFRVRANQLNDRLLNYQPNDQIQVTVFHDEELRTYSVTLTESRPTAYKIQPLDNLTQAQQDLGERWLGVNPKLLGS